MATKRGPDLGMLDTIHVVGVKTEEVEVSCGCVEH